MHEESSKTPARRLIGQLRVVFTLVPWRMRPRLIALAAGSILMAIADMGAVVLVLPVMQLLSGTSISDSPVLSRIATFLATWDRNQLLLATLVAVLGLMVGKNLAMIAFRWWSLRLMARAQADATRELMRLFSTSPWSAHRRRSSERALQSLNVYVGSAFTGVTSPLVALVADLVSMVSLLVVLAVVSAPATVAAGVFFAGSAMLIQRSLKGRVSRLALEARDANIASWKYLGTAIDGFRDVQVANAGPRFADGFSRNRQTVAEATARTTFLNELPRYLLEVVMVLGILVISAVLIWTAPGDRAFAFLGVFAVAALRIIPSLNRIVGTLGVIRSNRPNLDGLVDDVVELRGEPGRAAAPETEHDFPLADLLFKDVSFSFPDDPTPVLQGVSGVIPAGHTVALVGASGAGKSTFMDLLIGLFTPNEGVMAVDGVSIHHHPVSWRRQLGVVSQSVYLMDDTILANITLGVDEDEVDPARLRDAIEMAQLGAFIDSLPDGLNTKVGWGGTRTSGGQRQRIGIARALYRDPQVLLLDEATSALDNETEAEITKTLHGLQGSRTIVVIAHRLSTVKHADSILFFSGGKIAGRGTMAELVRTNDEFANLVRLGGLT